MSKTRREPPLVEVLDEPIVKLLMAADRVDERTLRSLLRTVTRNLKAEGDRLAA